MKNKIQLKLSDKEKKMLMVLAGAGILFLAYTFGFQKLSDEKVKLKSDEAVLQKQFDILKGYEDNLENIKSETVQAKDAIVEYDTMFPCEVNQKGAIMFTQFIEDAIGIDFSVAQTAPPIEVQRLAALAGIAKTQMTEITGQEYEVSTGSVAGSSVLKSMDISYNFSGTYSQLKDTLVYLNRYPKRSVLRNVNLSIASSDGGSSVVQGTLTYKQYAIDADNRINDPKLDLTVNTGVSSILHQAAASATKYNNSLLSASDPETDFIIKAGPSNADRPAIEFGPAGGERYDYISKTGDITHSATIIFTGGAAEGYTATYTLGGVKKSKVVNLGSVLKVAVEGEPYKSADDRTKVNLTIINQTDLTVSTENFLKDVPENPRFKIYITEGGQTREIKGVE